VLVVWTDDFRTIIPLAREFEEKLIELMWKKRLASSTRSSTLQSLTATSSDVGLNEKTGPGSGSPEPTAHGKVPKSQWAFGWKAPSKALTAPMDQDPEKGVPEHIHRRMRMFAPFYNGLGCALALCKLFPPPGFVL
jgi:hypothetical protein